MNKQHAELFANLHQLAATVTTVFEVLADVKPEGHREAPTTTPPQPEPETKAAEPRDGACLACGRPCDSMAARVQCGRICVDCVGASVEDLQRQSERSRLAGIAGHIYDQLTALGKLASDAIDLDGARSLPILDREVLRLCDLFRARRGPFAGEPGPAGVVYDDADLDLPLSSRPGAGPA
jgi:hypothetical protein